MGALASGRDRVFTVAPDVNRVRAERHFGGQVLRCFEARVAGYDALIRQAVAARPEGEAIVCGERRLSWREVDDLIDVVAGNLLQRGIVAGDRIAVMLDNRLEFFLSVYAAIRIGAIAVPLGTRLGPVETGYILGHSGAAVLITAEEFRGRLPADLPEELAIFALDAAGAGAEPFEHLLVNAPRPPVLWEDEEATALIVYTSGTTGKPKGARLAHLAFAHSALHYLYGLQLEVPQRGLLAIPGSHIAGFMALVTTTIATAGTLVLQREFKARATLELMAKERVTYTVLVPAMFQLCLADPDFDAAALTAWRTVVYGGAIMPPAVVEDAAAKLPGLRLVNAYGSTETCAPATIMPFDATAGRTASIGIAVHCGEIAVMDDEGREVPRGQPGELWIRGPMVSPGYWRDEAATAANFVAGYWLSGDIGTMDEEGFLTVHDRKKDMIVRGGYKVFSAEVENAIIAFGGVEECAVVPVPCPILGERVFAFVKPGREGLKSEDLKQWLRGRIADYKNPDHVELTDDPLDRNQNGKLQKASLREKAETIWERVQPRRDRA